MENEQFTLLELYENGGNEIDSSKIGFSSPKNVNWKCSQCRMEWKQTLNKATLKTKSNKKESPYCMHTRPSKFYNLITKYPILEKEWNYEKKLRLPTEYLPNSHKKVWWICEYNSNHSWMDRIANRTILNRKCPICSKEFTVSFPARVLYYYLKPYFEDCEIEYRFLGKYTLDIYLPYYKIVIEYDGWYYHSNKESEKRENKKDKLLLDNNINIIRIKEKKEEMSDIIYENNIISYHLNEGYTNLDKLVEKVLSIIEEETNIKMKKMLMLKEIIRKLKIYIIT